MKQVQTLTLLGQSTQYVMDGKRQRKEVYGEKQEKKKKKKNKVEEFQLAKPASLGSQKQKWLLNTV